MNITDNNHQALNLDYSYFVTPDLTQRLDLISHLLANTALTPYIQAHDGGGKSRLAHHLSELLDENYQVCLIDGAGIDHPDNLVEIISSAAHQLGQVENP